MNEIYKIPGWIITYEDFHKYTAYLRFRLMELKSHCGESSHEIKYSFYRKLYEEHSYDYDPTVRKHIEDLHERVLNINSQFTKFLDSCSDVNMDFKPKEENEN